MIKIMNVTPKETFKINKTTFEQGVQYKAYNKHGNTFVQNNSLRVEFGQHIAGHFRDDVPEFKEYFNIIQEGHVRNKEELKKYLKDIKEDELLFEVSDEVLTKEEEKELSNLYGERAKDVFKNYEVMLPNETFSEFMRRVEKESK